MRFLDDRQSRRARRWSNRELRGLAPLFSGRIANVSGWKDEDKEGGTYRGYFTQASRYVVTNHRGDRGGQGGADEIEIDLEKEIPSDLLQSFDVVLNHTVLEHIFDVFTAFRNLCALSRDVVIVVVPFSQNEHWTDSYGDYWRFTPQTLARLFSREGFTLVYVNANNDFNSAIYVIGVGVRDPANWAGRLPKSPSRRAVGDRIGRAFVFDQVVQIVRSLRRRLG